MSKNSAVKWFDDFIGIAYRYYEIRMTVAPLFDDRKEAAKLWRETIHWWNDHSIKIRFVEIDDNYWFIMGAESKETKNIKFLFKVLPKSSYYERFKKGHDGSAYLRFGTYAKKYKNEVKDDAVCDCKHRKDDHEEGEYDECLVEDCDCKKFESFQINLLKKKKTITNIKFLTEDQIKDDVLAWNCFSVNKYNKKQESDAE